MNCPPELHQARQEYIDSMAVAEAAELEARRLRKVARRNSEIYEHLLLQHNGQLVLPIQGPLEATKENR